MRRKATCVSKICFPPRNVLRRKQPHTLVLLPLHLYPSNHSSTVLKNFQIGGQVITSMRSSSCLILPNNLPMFLLLCRSISIKVCLHISNRFKCLKSTLKLSSGLMTLVEPSAKRIHFKRKVYKKIGDIEVSFVR